MTEKKKGCQAKTDKSEVRGGRFSGPSIFRWWKMEILGKLVEKMDKKMEEKSKEKGCCCGDSEESCCK